MTDLKKRLEEKQAEIEKHNRELEELRLQVKSVYRDELAKLVEKATANGMTIEELFEGFVSFSTAKGKKKRAGGERKEIADRFSDGTNTWSGRGAMPKWFVEAVEKGKTVRSLLIDKSDKGDIPTFWYSDERGTRRSWDGSLKPGLFVKNEAGSYPYFTQQIIEAKTPASALKALMEHLIPGSKVDEKHLTEMIGQVRARFEA